MKILLTGGSGVLGQELQKYLICVTPSHEEFDITKKPSKKVEGAYDVIIHSAAYTDVPRAEMEKKKCFQVNVEGTYNVIKTFPNTKFIYISSEYANKPVNYYSYTKLWGEEIVRSKASSYLIIRTLFKPRPFPYEYAFFDQWTQGDYVDIIAPMIVKELLKGTTGSVTLGTGRKTMFQLARRSNPDIKAISVDDIVDVVLPKDYV